jgi:hypothetical protein
MLKRLVRLGAGALARALEPKPPAESGPPPFDSPRSRDEELDQAEAEAAARAAADEDQKELARDRDTWKRKAEEYFKLIEGVIAEREIWKKMWFDDSGGHQQAQAVLEEMIVKGRQFYQRALAELNAMRKAKGLEPLNWNLETAGAPEGTAAATAKRNAELAASAPAGIDALAERDRIAAGDPPAGEGKGST